MPRWQPAKPRTRIRVVERGRGHWEERDHALDIPHGIDTFDFKLTETGHERLERIFLDCCAERRTRGGIEGQAGRATDREVDMPPRLFLCIVRHESTRHGCQL